MVGSLREGWVRTGSDVTSVTASPARRRALLAASAPSGAASALRLAPRSRRRAVAPVAPGPSATSNPRLCLSLTTPRASLSAPV